MLNNFRSLIPVLAVAACTSSQPPGEPPEPLQCAIVSPCGPGFACALERQQCEPSPIAIDTRDLFEDGGRLLAKSSGPELTGIVFDPTTTAVKVLVNDRVIGADFAHDRWSVRLPEGTLSIRSTRVTFRAVTAEGTFELVRTLAVDVSAPFVTVTSATRDERGDLIDFSSGRPVHTHLGPVIEAREDCADVYKHAYLMDPEPGPGVAETSPNPLAWTFLPLGKGIQGDGAGFRIRAENGTLLRDWTFFGRRLDQVYTATLFRSGWGGIPALGTKAQRLYIDAVFHDWKGVPAEITVCWDHHPMPYPAEPVPLRRGLLAPAASHLSDEH